MPARFYEQEVEARLKNRKELSASLDREIKAYKPEAEQIKLTYVFCNDEFLHGINVQFLNHDDYTDIITFDLSGDSKELLGEIYISVERVKENAGIFNTSYEHELLRVIFHGALHLCGLRDKTENEKKAMRFAENAALVKWYDSKKQ